LRERERDLDYLKIIRRSVNNDSLSKHHIITNSHVLEMI
jgi:hypothetical protein